MSFTSLSPEVQPLGEQYLADLAESDIRLRIPSSEHLPSRMSGKLVTPDQWREYILHFTGIWANAAERSQNLKASARARTLSSKRAAEAKTALIALQLATEHAPDFEIPDPDLYVN